MLRLISVEFNKLIRRKKFIIGTAMLILMFFLSLGMILFYRVETLGVDKQIKEAKKVINTYEQQLKLQQDKGTSEDISNGYNKIINDQKKDLEKLQTLANESIPWQERVEKDIEYSRDKIKRLGFSDSIKEAENGNILLKQYYLDNDIPYNYNENLDFFSVIPDVLYVFGLFGLFIIIGVMVVDVISGENKPATIKMLLTKPLERWKVIFSKFLVCVITVNLLVLGVEFLCFTILGFIFGFGDPSLPTLFGTTYSSVPAAYINELKAVVTPVIGSTMLITKGTLILKVLILQSLGITACIAFCLLCSTLIENSGTSTGTALFFITFMQVMMIYKNINQFDLKPPGFINKILPYLFTTYYDGGVVISGKINQALGITFVNFNFAVMVMLGWIVVCYSISHLIFVKKDFVA